MTEENISGREAGLLFGAAMVLSMAGIFAGIFMLFVNIDIAVRIMTAVSVGIVGIVSFLRHSIWYRSDQVRMGWHQDHPQFQREVGFANLAIGIWGLIVAVFNGGALACGVLLATYGTYLLCTFFLHLQEALSGKNRERARRSVFSTGMFVIVLVAFAAIAFAHAGAIPFVNV